METSQIQHQRASDEWKISQKEVRCISIIFNLFNKHLRLVRATIIFAFAFPQMTIAFLKRIIRNIRCIFWRMCNVYCMTLFITAIIHLRTLSLCHFATNLKAFLTVSVVLWWRNNAETLPFILHFSTNMRRRSWSAWTGMESRTYPVRTVQTEKILELSFAFYQRFWSRPKRGQVPTICVWSNQHHCWTQLQVREHQLSKLVGRVHSRKWYR